MHEARYHTENAFLTLTYKDFELVEGISKVTGNVRATLHPEHLTKFWKRFRKAGHHVRYFACGEYGDKLGRPHYHACIFGYSPQDKIHHSTKNGNPLYTSQYLDSLWTHGAVYTGDVSFESASYVARYVMKKLNGKEAHYYEDEGIQSEFVRMSRRPGIGNQFFNDFSSDMFPMDTVVMRDGHKQRPPRYYSTLLEKKDPIAYEEVKAQRKLQQGRNEEAFNKRRLAVKERFKKAQTKNLDRNLE